MTIFIVIDRSGNGIFINKYGIGIKKNISHMPVPVAARSKE
jgi:hypothetical protein